MSLFNQLKLKIVMLLAVLGPGTVAAIANNDAGGIATYSVAASMYGYASRFLIFLEIMLLAVTQEIGARVAIVTKKGLGDLIRERFGIKWSLFIFAIMFMANQMVVIQNIAGIRASLVLLNLPYEIFLPIIVLLIWLFLLKGNYSSIQKGFLLLTIFYFAYVISAFQSNPDWGKAITNAFWPSDTKITFPYIFARIAVLGTTITAWGQFFIHSYVRDKNLDIEKLKYEKTEVYFGSLLTNFFSFMIMVAVSTTIFVHGIHITSAQEAAQAIRPFAGELAYIFFSYGLFVASILGAAIVPLATAYAFSEFFGFERSLDKSFSQSKMFYTFLILQLLLGFLIALIPNYSLFKITLYANFANGSILPLIFFFLFRFANDESIMGKYINSKFENILLISSIIVITIAVLITIYGSIFLNQ